MIPTLVQAASQVTRLTESNGDWIGLSPFKDERTPSFRVNANRFKCFSTGIGGGWKKWKELFPDTVIGLNYEYSTWNTGKEADPDGADEVRQKIQSILSYPHKPTNEYLNSRNLSWEELVPWGVGYMRLDSLNRLTQAEREVANKLGYFLRTGKPALVGMMTIPIISFRTPDKIIGHNGRSIYPHWQGSKYSMVLKHKSDGCIFDPLDDSPPVLVEGMFDAFKTPGGICTLGCHPSPELYAAIKKVYPKKIFGYDADQAGLDAMFRYIEVGDTYRHWAKYGDDGATAESYIDYLVTGDFVSMIELKPEHQELFKKYVESNKKHGYHLLNVLPYCIRAFPHLKIQDAVDAYDGSDESAKNLLKVWKQSGAEVRRRDNKS